MKTYKLLSFKAKIQGWPRTLGFVHVRGDSRYIARTYSRFAGRRVAASRRASRHPARAARGRASLGPAGRLCPVRLGPALGVSPSGVCYLRCNLPLRGGWGHDRQHPIHPDDRWSLGLRIPVSTRPRYSYCNAMFGDSRRAVPRGACVYYQVWAGDRQMQPFPV